MTFSVTSVDIAVLLIYVLGSRLAFGWYLARKKAVSANAEKYFLADRNLAWPIIGFSFYVSNMSGSTFVGLPGTGYHDGIAVYNYEWSSAVVLIVFAWIVLPLFLRARVFTAPGFLEKRFDARSKLAFSAFLLLANILIDASGAIYAGGMVLKVLFPDVPLWQFAALISAIAGVYIFFGGLDAVVLNDVLQAIMIFIGGILIATIAWLRLPSWDAVTAAMPAEKLSLIRPASDTFLPWPGLLSGLLIVSLYFWCTNQFIIQRALGARTLEHGRRGSLFAGLLKLPNLFILVLPGVMATVLIPDLPRADMVFPALAFHILPIGLRGLMLAALAAAILSSLESIYNSAATLFTMDFVAHFRPQTSDRGLVVVGRIATLGFMVLAAAWAPQIERFPTLWEYLQSVLSYITPPVVAVFVVGMLWTGATARAAFVTLAVGIPLGVGGWVANELTHGMSIHYLYASGVLFLANTGIMALVSLLGRTPVPREAAELVWRPAGGSQDRERGRRPPRWQDFRYLSFALLVPTVIIVIWWW